MLAFISCPPAARLPRRAGGLLALPQAVTCRMCPHGESCCWVGPPVGWGAAGPCWGVVLGSGRQGALQDSAWAAARCLRAAFSMLKTRAASSGNGDGLGACASSSRGSSFPILCWGCGDLPLTPSNPGDAQSMSPGHLGLSSTSIPPPKHCAVPFLPCLCPVLSLRSPLRPGDAGAGCG